MKTLLLGLIISVTGSLLSPQAWAEKPIPEVPYYYLLDEAKVLGTQETYALQTLLIKHDRATGEQFMIAIFDSLENEDPDAFSVRVFQSWKVGQRGKNNGILLVLFWKDQKARIEVGFGLESALSETKARAVLDDFLIPELKTGNPGRALAQASMEILRILESPLIQSGDAETILSSGHFERKFLPTSERMRQGWFIIVGLGILGLAGVIWKFLGVDVHFTATGWFRLRPWEAILAGRTFKRRRQDSHSIAIGGGASGRW